MNQNRGISNQGFFRLPTSLPAIWDQLEEKMSQLARFNSNDEGVTISEDNQCIYVEANLPGLKQPDIDVSFHQNTLWIKGEKHQEESDGQKKYYRKASDSFFYQLDLPSPVDENPDQAIFKDGVLKIVFKKAQQAQRKKITICEDGSCKTSQENQTISKQNQTTSKESQAKETSKR